MQKIILGIWVIVFILGCSAPATTPPPSPALEAGMPAPEFNLPSAQGDRYDLADLRGQAALLSFIHSHPADASLTTPDPSRSQIVFLKSLHQQYASRGVRVLLVEATALGGGEPPDPEAALNFARNWDMETIPLLVDDGRLARDYGVTQIPTTLLITAQGIVAQRWEGFASAAQLALALQSLVGIPSSGVEFPPE